RINARTISKSFATQVTNGISPQPDANSLGTGPTRALSASGIKLFAHDFLLQFLLYLFNPTQIQEPVRRHCSFHLHRQSNFVFEYVLSSFRRRHTGNTLRKSTNITLDRVR